MQGRRDTYCVDSAHTRAEKASPMPPDLLKTIQRRALTGILTVLWIVVPYSLLQLIAIREVIWVKPSTFDLAIPINFHSLWFYLTFYGLLGWIGLSVDDRNFHRYIRSIWWTAFFSHLVFLLIPNGVTREAIDHDSAPLVYQWLVLADQPRNAFPSLHASLSVLAGLAAIASPLIRPLLKTAAWTWVIGILWSTIALRQHYAVDLISGSALAVVVWIIVGRKRE
jgi:membrane-associated phospholipid phosphatase